MISIGTVFYKEDTNQVLKFLDHLKKNFSNCEKIQEIIFVLNAPNSDLQEILQNFLTQSSLIITGKSLILINPDNNIATARKKIVLQSSTEWIYFVDPDVVVYPDTIKKLQNIVHNIKNDRLLGICGELVQRSNGKYLNQAFSIFSKISGIFEFNFQSTRREKFCFVDHAPTAHLALNKSKVLNLGNFSEQYNQVGEDLDLTHRATQAGFSIYFADLPAYHDQNFSIGVAIKKFFKYGQVQPEVFLKNGFSKDRCYRLLPMALFLVGIIVLCFELKIVLLMVPFLLATLLLQPAWMLALGLTIVYSCGSCWGIIKQLKKIFKTR